MKIGRPRTLLSLILLGLALVTLPLLYAVGNAVLMLGQLANESETVVSDSAAKTLENQRLVSALADMERNARQYLVLRDRDLLALYDSERAVFEESLAALAVMPQTDAITARLRQLEMLSGRARALLRDAPPVEALGRVVECFVEMNSAARDMAQSVRVLINGRLNGVQESTRSAQRSLAWQSAALVPSTLLFVLLFLFEVGRPMRQVDRAIRALGEGDFNRDVMVSGPRDIETLGRQLEWLRHRLKESSEGKNRFLRHMSHELKTPLANIREGSELLMDGSVGFLDHQQREVAGILRENSVKLQSLIENLLMFSAWQTRTASLELTGFELKPMVFSALSQHRLAISKKRIKMDVKVSPVGIHADEGKLKLVMDNLISNAVKFTPSNGAILVAAGMQGGELVIDVADTGPGVHAKDRDRIFAAFYQGRNLHGGRVGGTGIGLSVVSECVEAHGGSVRLLDTDRGAHFQVRLPLRRATDAAPLAVASG